MNGAACSLKWKQEQQNELWIGRHNRPNAVMAKDPSLVSPDVLPLCASAGRASGGVGGCILQSDQGCVRMDSRRGGARREAGDAAHI